MSLPEVPCEKWAGDHTMVKTCTKTGVSVGSDVGRVIDKHSVHKMFPTNHSLWSYPRILSLYACFNPISWKTNKHVWYTSNILTSITVIPSRNPGWFEGRYPSEFSKKKTSHWNDHCFTRSHLSLSCSALPFCWSRLGQEDLPKKPCRRCGRTWQPLTTCALWWDIVCIYHIYITVDIIFMYGSHVDQLHPTAL